jgi:hypothetical protein
MKPATLKRPGSSRVYAIPLTEKQWRTLEALTAELAAAMDQDEDGRESTAAFRRRRDHMLDIAVRIGRGLKTLGLGATTK